MKTLTAIATINLIRAYRFLFARKVFYGLNKLLYLCSLRGLGFLNYETNAISGERNFLSYLKHKSNPTVFDVGANIGSYSSEVFKNNANASLYAFEPHPINYRNLIDNVKHPNFHPYNCAVGHETGFLSIYDYDGHDGSTHASLYEDVIEVIHNSKSTKHDVRVITLDSFIRSNSIDTVDLLKIDAEGHELHIIQGVLEHLSQGKIKVIQFEFNEMNVISGTFFRDFWNILSDYKLYKMLPDGLVEIKSYSPIYCEIFACQNVVAVLKDEMN